MCHERERDRPRTVLHSQVHSPHNSIAPEYLMHRLRANHHAYAYDDYNHDRAQHRRKRGRVLLAEVIHVCHPRAYTTTRR